MQSLITELNIENFVIIDKVSIVFEEGLNIITGETGSGKSIIIDAINLLLGERSERSFILNGEEKTIIEGNFAVPYESNIREILDSYGIDNRDDTNIIITREIHMNGRSVARINSRNVTINVLKSISHKLLNIQGQNQNSEIFNQNEKINILDRFCGETIKDIKNEIYRFYQEIKTIEEQIKKNNINDMEKERTIELLKFQIEEIEEANLNKEDENLEEEYKLISKVEEVKSTIGQSIYNISSDSEDSRGILYNLKNIQSQISKISDYNKNIEKLGEELSNIIFQLEDFNNNISNFNERLEYSSQELNDITSRLDLINSLKRKYGKSIEEIIEYKKKIISEVEDIENIDKILKESIRIKEKKVKEYIELSKKLTYMRIKASEILENKLSKEFQELGMKEAIFKIEIYEKNEISANGMDHIVFKIAINKGQELEELSKVISGGELSRIMLSIKNIIAEEEQFTLVFDEIDTGVSGITAQLIAKKILEVSKKNQIICITHLPQIASMGNSHFNITKEIKGKNTFAKVLKLDDTGKIEEITRLLGGEIATETGRNHAKEMLKFSKKQRENIFDKP